MRLVIDQKRVSSEIEALAQVSDTPRPSATRVRGPVGGAQLAIGMRVLAITLTKLTM